MNWLLDKLAVITLLATLTLFMIQPQANAQSGCATDDLGRVLCAPPGGSAVGTLSGVVCAPGQCVTDNLGYLKCARESGGSATTDNLGKAVCVGGCVNPSKEFCVEQKSETK